MNEDNEKLYALQAKCPFTIMMLTEGQGLCAKQLYTVTNIFSESDIIMAMLLEIPDAVEYNDTNFQWLKVYGPN